jgi:hypothetical protein
MKRYDPKQYVFVIVGLALAVAGLYVRAQNARPAHQQADAIVAADAAGNDTAAQRDRLADYVQLHAGASVTYTLTGSYNRALEAHKAAIAAASSANSQIYLDAQRACAGKTSSVTQAKCNHDYVASRLQAIPPAPTNPPQQAAYTYKHTSPLWTPDLAGALLLGGSLALGVGVAMLVPRKRKRR